ncbi:GGDEF domain-containing phosphodiesterase [Sphingomonas kaistensis]|uniref:GGDEF domain-containing phosphodiesterase n=1 Tax=Sphingomonas kaistensis TaxID=298708 RepID=A0ABZ2G425_9SPHN
MMMATTALTASMPCLPVTSIRPELHGLSSQLACNWNLLPVKAVRELAARPQPLAVFEDAITGLANILALRHMIDGLIEARRDFGLILLEVHDLCTGKDVANYGRQQQIASALDGMVRIDGAVARLNESTFALLLPGVTSRRTLERCAAKTCVRIKNALADGQLIPVQAIAGAAIYPLHGRTREDVLRSAGAALAETRNPDRQQVKVFTRSLELRARQHQAALQRAAACIARPDGLALVYQPKINLKTGQVAGYEALLRCQDSLGRKHPPMWIAPAFSIRDLSVTIGTRVLDQALDFLGKLCRSNRTDAHVAINVTATELSDQHWVASVLRSLERSGICPSALEIEVTETVLLHGSSTTVIRSLQKLRSAGTKVSLDDFGTGYASLTHLRSCPVDTLKVDRSFVRCLHESDSAAIVRSMVDLASDLQLNVVAEGVENASQHRQLTDWGCRQGQGFYYARPAGAEYWLKSSKITSR